MGGAHLALAITDKVGDSELPDHKNIAYTQRIAYKLYMTNVIHNRIALFRAERGVSRKALAAAVGVNVQTIGYLERGDYNPSLELGMKLAAFFGVPLELLFSFSPFESVVDMLMRTEGDR